MEEVTLKKKLKKTCIADVENRIKTAEESINRAQESANETTKSSAGDKHETQRALMQNEREKAEYQLAKALNLMKALQNLRVGKKASEVENGTIVFTDKRKFFISAALGKIEIDEGEFMAMALASPLAKAMEGKKEGESVTFRDQTYKIEKIY